jgi:ribosomal protection tetracycline resistance protein
MAGPPRQVDGWKGQLMSESGMTNIGIIAHVDAGKTTLTEQLLFRSGAILRAGSVDNGTAQTDYMDVERSRGISVKAATTYIQWQGREINLIDTPGHIDFAAEVERSLRVLDAAVLCLSAVEGVQAQSEQYYFALRKLGIPVLIFINKTDRIGADVAYVRRQIQQILGPETISFTESDSWLTFLADYEETLADAWLENRPVTRNDLLGALARQNKCGKILPYVMGSALKGEGIEDLLSMICALAPPAEGDRSGPVAGIVFKVEHDKRLGRIAYVRLYSGTLKNRDTVSSQSRGSFGKIVQIRKASGRKAVDIGVLSAGDIAAVCGLNDVVAGDAIGDESLLPQAIVTVVQPLLRVRLLPEREQDYTKLAAACTELAAEDPKMKMIWEPGIRQMLLHVTGTIQVEILEALMRDRFGLAVTLENPQVIYKETPVQPAIGSDAYTMPKPCWAVVTFAIEPLPLGQGVIYTSAISDMKIRDRYQGQIEQTIPLALEQGPRGWEVTDIRITLIDGADHPVHTHPLDFATVTPMALMKGLDAAGTRLLEPVLRFRLTVPLLDQGKMISQIIAMRGMLDKDTQSESGVEPAAYELTRFTLTGRVPVATSLDFPVYVAQMTSGRGILTMVFDGYEPCPEGMGEDASYRGVNPLDRERYILHVRGAMR